MFTVVEEVADRRRRLTWFFEYLIFTSRSRLLTAATRSQLEENMLWMMDVSKAYEFDDLSSNSDDQVQSFSNTTLTEISKLIPSAKIIVTKVLSESGKTTVPKMTSD